MKILLATLALEPESRNNNDSDAPYSLGLAYLYSILETAGHSPRLLFLNNVDYSVSEEAFFRAVAEMRPEVVAFQVFTMNRVSTFAAMEKLQVLYPGIRIVLGGVHASTMSPQILEKFHASIIVRGEGEITLLELLDVFLGKRNLQDVAGLAYWDGGVKLTRERELIEDLDSLPNPKHEIFFESDASRTVAHVISSRGCPFDCSFCCLKVISRRRYRTRDIGLVLEEIKELKQKYPRLAEVQFHDDTFLLDNKRVIEFCRMAVKEKLGLRFVCSARVKPVSGEMFSWMKKAGFVKIMFGLETGSPRLLESIHKAITREDVLNLFHVIKPYDFNITTFLMCGFPGETAETVQETIELVQQTQRISYNLVAGVGKLWVYPGTEVYEVMKAAGGISDDFWLGDAPVPYFTAEHDLKTLVGYEERMLDSLSFRRILTRKGFFGHFLKMPGIITRFLLKPRNRRLLLIALIYPFRSRFPGAYLKLYEVYSKMREVVISGRLRDHADMRGSI